MLGNDKISFSWDAGKATVNLRKHGVSFDEAATVFYDDDAIEFFDTEHSKKEDRFVLLGRSRNLRILVVCHCHRDFADGKEEIRIISARKADAQERKHYIGR
jgi:uncharacterized DUF497 family protein